MKSFAVQITKVSILAMEMYVNWILLIVDKHVYVYF